MTKKILTGKPTGGTLVESTDRSLTLYVATTGSDSNDGLTSGTALLTIQAAVDKVPKFVNHDVTVNIGAGNFAGFYLGSFSLKRGITFTVQGTLGAPTLTTGTTSGTSTGGALTQLIDGGQNWTVNELRGRLLFINSEYRVIRNNTTTTINIVGPSTSTCSGKVYSLLEQKTVVNDRTTLSIPYASRIVVFGNSIIRNEYNPGMILADLKTTGGEYGIIVHETAGCMLRRIYSSGASVDGMGAQDTTGQMQWEDCYSAGCAYGIVAIEIGTMARFWRIYAYNNTAGGVWCSGPGSFADSEDIYADYNTGSYGIFAGSACEVYLSRVFAEYNTGIGIRLTGNHRVYLQTSCTVTNNSDTGITADAFVSVENGTITSNGGYGIVAGNYSDAQDTSYLVLIGSAAISTNSLGGILVKDKSTASVGTITGSSTGYGIEAQSGGTVYITSATAITGTTGNSTIDAGATTLTWATDFANNGDRATNLANGCVIERKD